MNNTVAVTAKKIFHTEYYCLSNWENKIQRICKINSRPQCRFFHGLYLIIIWSCAYQCRLCRVKYRHLHRMLLYWFGISALDYKNTAGLVNSHPGSTNVTVTALWIDAYQTVSTTSSGWILRQHTGAVCRYDVAGPIPFTMMLLMWNRCLQSGLYKQTTAQPRSAACVCGWFHDPTQTYHSDGDAIDFPCLFQCRGGQRQRVIWEAMDVSRNTDRICSLSRVMGMDDTYIMALVCKNGSQGLFLYDCVLRTW